MKDTPRPELESVPTDDSVNLPFEEPKLTFVEPKLTPRGDLRDVTAGALGPFSP